MMFGGHRSFVCGRAGSAASMTNCPSDQSISFEKPFQFSLASLFRWQTAIMGILVAAILSASLPGHGGTVVLDAVFGAIFGYVVPPASLGIIRRCLLTVAFAALNSVLPDKHSSGVELVAVGLIGALIGAFLFLGFGGRLPPRRKPVVRG